MAPIACLAMSYTMLFAESIPVISMIPSIPTAFSQTPWLGKKVSLNFQSIPVRAALQLLAEISGTNMIISDKVSGKLTLRLKEVPWDQALSMILAAKSLAKEQVGAVMMIGFPVEKPLVALPGSSMTLQHAKVPLHARRAGEVARLIRQQSNRFLSPDGGLQVDKQTNSLWIHDRAVNIHRIRAWIKRVDSAIPQVLIESRIVEVTKDLTHELGLQFSVLPTATGQLAKRLSSVGATRERLHMDLGTAMTHPTSTVMGLAVATLGDNILLDLELSALESENKAEVVARPRLITANQQEAHIESGEEVPYQQSTVSGATSVSFKKAVLSLRVTPLILSEGRMMMKLKVNQDHPSSLLLNGTPVITTKEIETQVLVKSGQTIVLGGIYQRNQINQVVRVPFLGKLPVVGAWFRRTVVVAHNEELLIFITPKIIEDNER